MKTTMRYAAALVVLAAVAGGVISQAADKKADLSRLPPAAAKAGVTYAKDIQPLMERSCLKCHSGDRPKGRYSMETFQGVLKGGDEHGAVKPGKIAESPMLHFAADLVPEMEMPPVDKRDKYPALTKAEVALLRAWIEQGAK